MTSLTMRAIAKMAEVSVSTVSRTFHAPHLVDPDTRSKIMLIAEQHNYIYNATAGNLSRKKSSLIGVLIPSANKSFFGDSLIAMQEQAQRHGYSLIIGNTMYDHQIEMKLVGQFMQHQVAGMILTGYHKKNETFIGNMNFKELPCVFTWETMADPVFNFVGFDNFDAAFRMTEYLISLRHRRIGLVIGPYSKMSRIASRLEGYKAALKKNDIEFDPMLVQEREPNLIEGKESMRTLLALENRPTAVFAASDTLAIGAMAIAKKKGFRIPQDLSVAGFDDLEFSAYCDPPLTTIQVPSYEMGSRAMAVLLEMIERGSSQVRQYELGTDLVIRKSCAALKP